MRHEAIEYCKSIRLNIPGLIDKGKGYKYKVNQQQVEAACEYFYLQVRDYGFDPFAPGLRLPVYILNRAKKIRIGQYYKVNKGDPILLDDLTALTTLARNLLNVNEMLANANEMLDWTQNKLLLWKFIAYTVFVGLSFVIFKTNWYY